MKLLMLSRWIAAGLALICATWMQAAQDKVNSNVNPLKLAGTEFHHRWSKDDQNEYTPSGQEDLSLWRDMLTINYYRKATDGETLAAITNAVLQNYQNKGAKILRTNSVPRTAEKPAEHLIVAVFPEPSFIEIVFARFRLTTGIGSAAIYSHRVYGQKAAEEAGAWLKKNGPTTEQALMAWTDLPAP